MLQIYNSLTKQKEAFQPIKPGKIGIYVCGMTVYDFCHVGNARVFIFFDTVVRFLRSIEFDVTYVRNITDVDDKIIKRAKASGVTYKQIAQQFIDYLHEDTKRLGLLDPDYEPRVTEHIAEIIDIIEILLAKGYAYVAQNGDVYYSIDKFSAYGKLAHQDLEQLQVGARVEANAAKRNLLDFVLWKRTKTADEPGWSSPWGYGRPGWHIECSVMSKLYLGERFDIHGGGADLQFPHHQNEVAQSEAAWECKFVNYWMHVGFVRVDNEKMSKSLGNFFTVREVLKKYHPEVIRYFLLSSHYRSPLNYTAENLENAQAALERLYVALRGLNPKRDNDPKSQAAIAALDAFREAMGDDFNTSRALAVMFDLTREINKLREAGAIADANCLAETLIAMGEIFGILQSDPEEFLQKSAEAVDVAKINELLAARTAARQNKDWHLADQIRDKLSAMGIVIEDTAEGSIWRK